MPTPPVTDVDIQGTRVPALGFGTFRLTGQSCREMVQTAVRLGYRHIDTAQMYDNEAAVGAALAASGVARAEIFLTTKVWPDRFRAGVLERSVEESLRKLGTDYVDLLLLHWPNPEVPLAETIGALNAVRRAGQARQIGVSNFTTQLLAEAQQASDAPLLINQVEYHPFLDQSVLLQALRQRRMGLTAYSPLAQGKVAGHPVLSTIGRRYGKTAGQVALRWLVQQDCVIAIPKSASPARAQENLDIFDFSLEETEMQEIFALGARTGRLIDPAGLAPAWD